MRRDDNIRVFLDTQKQVKERQELADAVKNSNSKQVLIPQISSVTEMMPDFNINHNRFQDDARIIISKKRTYEAASVYKDMKVCVLNFASATNPGGGVVKGSSAQEECLCRCSTLYFNLNTSDMWDGFYTPHRNAKDPLHNDDCIYTPDVVVFKTDTGEPEMMDENEWYKVNVVTCAAPNLRLVPGNSMNSGDGDKNVKISDEQLLKLHEKRLSRIIEVAVAGGNEVIILGAFGCGAFENNPKVVAQASRNVIEKYRKCFKTIEFAIYCREYETENYDAFCRAFSEMQVI